jgi:hypothetical protein
MQGVVQATIDTKTKEGGAGGWVPLTTRMKIDQHLIAADTIVRRAILENSKLESRSTTIGELIDQAAELVNEASQLLAKHAESLRPEKGATS